MTDHVYKQIEITGSSQTGIEDAVRIAVAKAASSVRNMHWFQVTETRGFIEADQIKYWQVTVKVGFRLED